MNGNITDLLEQYGTGLEDTKKLLAALKGRQQPAGFTAPQIFDWDEAKQFGVDLQEGWMLKVTPDESEQGFSVSYITPDKWEITQDNLYISPEGKQYTQAELEAQQPSTEALAGQVFLGEDIQSILTYAEQNPEEFYNQIIQAGKTPDTEALLKAMGASEEYYNYLFMSDEERTNWVAQIQKIGRNDVTEALVKSVLSGISEDELNQFFTPPSITGQAKEAFKETYTGKEKWAGWGAVKNLLLAGLGVAGAYIEKYIQRPWKTAALEAEVHYAHAPEELTDEQLQAIYKEKWPAQKAKMEVEDQYVAELSRNLDATFKKYGWTAIFSEEVGQLFEGPYTEQRGKISAEVVSWANPIWWIPVGGIAGQGARVLSKVPVIGKVAKYTAAGVQAVEKGIAYPITKPMELGAAGLEKIGVRLGENYANKLIKESPHLTQFEVAPTADIEAELFANNWSKTVMKTLAKTPGIGQGVKFGIMKTLGPRELINLESHAVEDVVGRNMIVRLEIQREGMAAASAKMYELRAIAMDPVGLFGFDENAISKTIPRLSEKATGDLEDIFIHPELYQLTDKQLAYVTRLHKLNTEVLGFLEKEGLTPKNVTEGWWVHRVVVGEYDPAGELILVRGRPGMRGGALGTKRAFEMHRQFPTMAEGIKNGVKYSNNPEDYISTYLQEAYNKVADARFAAQVADFGTKPIDILRGKYPEVMQRAELTADELADATKLKAIVARAERGERIPEQTLKAMERRFPELGRRLRGLVTERVEGEAQLREYLAYIKKQSGELQGLLAKKETTAAASKVEAVRVIPDEQKLTEAFKVMSYEDRVAFRSSMEERVANIQEMLGEQSEELAGIKEFLESDPVATYTGFVGKKRLPLTSLLVKGKWPETITVKQAAMLKMGKEVSPAVIKNGRVSWEYVTDELADHFGMTEQQLIDRIEQIASYKQKEADLLLIIGSDEGTQADVRRMLDILNKVDVKYGGGIEPTGEISERGWGEGGQTWGGGYLEWQKTHATELAKYEPQFAQWEAEASRKGAAILRKKPIVPVSEEQLQEILAGRLPDPRRYMELYTYFPPNGEATKGIPDHLLASQTYRYYPFQKRTLLPSGEIRIKGTLTGTEHAILPSGEVRLIHPTTSYEALGAGRIPYNRAVAGVEKTVALTPDKDKALYAVNDLKAAGIKAHLEERTLNFKALKGKTYVILVDDPGDIGKALDLLPGNVKYTPYRGQNWRETLETYPRELLEPMAGYPKGEYPELDRIRKLVADVPDVTDPAEINYWLTKGDKQIYLEGWSDECLAGTGFPPMAEGETSRKIDYIKDLTPGILQRKAKEKGLTLIDGGFIERENAENLYGVTWGVYGKPEVIIPKAPIGMPEAGLQKDMFGYTAPVFPKGKGEIVQISMDEYNKLCQAWKDAGLPGGPSNVGIKPQIEGIKELGEKVSAWKMEFGVPEAKTATQRQAELRALRQQAELLMAERKGPYWQARTERAATMERIRQPGLEQGYIMQPMFGGKLYDREFIDAVNQWFGREKGLPGLKFTSDVAGILRTTEASLDASYLAIQGQPSFGLAHSYLLTNPKIGARMLGNWFKAYGISTAGFFKPEILAAALDKQVPITMERIGKMGSSATVDWIMPLTGQRGLAGLFGKVASKLPGNLYTRANFIFYGAGEMVRNSFFDILKPLAKNAGEEFQIAHALDITTGILDTKAMGIPLTVRQLENTFIWYASRYTRACLSVLAHIFRGNMTGALARRSIGGMISSGSFYYSAIQFTKSLLEGKSLDEAKDDVIAGFGVVVDPITHDITWEPSAKFMSFKIGNSYYGIGGFWYGLMRLAGNILACIDYVGDKGTIDFVKIIKYGSLNKDNPSINWWYSRSSPLTGTIYDLLFGTDYMGYPIETPAEYAWYIANQFTPIWLQSGAMPYVAQALKAWMPNLSQEYELPEGAARILTPVAELFGLRTFPEGEWVRFYDKANEIITHLPADLLGDYYTPAELEKVMAAQGEGKLTWKQLPATLKQKLLELYPELEELYSEAQAASLVSDSPAWKSYSARLEEERNARNTRIDNATHDFLMGDIDAKEWDQLCDDAESNYSKGYEDIASNPAYAEIFAYFARKEAEGTKYGWQDDIALAEYQDIIYATDLYDARTQTYNWDERDRRVNEFIDKWGMSVYDRVLWYLREKKKDTGLNELRVLHAKDLELLSREYWNLPYQEIYKMDANNKAAGDIPDQYLGLWQQYQDATDKEGFLKAHPELTEDFRAEYRAAHPEEDAMLKLWGYGGDLQTKAAYDILINRVKELGFTDEAMITMKLPPATIVDAFFGYKDVQREFSGNSAEAKLFRLEHEAFNTWGIEAYGWKELDENINALRLQVKWADMDSQYEAIETAEAKKAFLSANPEYAKARLMTQGYNLGITDEFIDLYAEYYTLPAKGYDKERFLKANSAYYNEVWLGVLGNQKIDFWKVPTESEENLLNKYDSLPTGSPRLAARCASKELDDALVKYRGLTKAYGTDRCG